MNIHSDREELLVLTLEELAALLQLHPIFKIVNVEKNSTVCDQIQIRIAQVDQIEEQDNVEFKELSQLLCMSSLSFRRGIEEVLPMQKAIDIGEPEVGVLRKYDWKANEILVKRRKEQRKYIKRALVRLMQEVQAQERWDLQCLLEEIGEV